MNNNEYVNKYHQYKRDLYDKLGHSFKRGSTLLDVGCGDGTDAYLMREIYGIEVAGTDIYRNPNLDLLGIDFSLGSILSLPYENATFDYAYAHDVLHHVDEDKQSREKHIAALRELKRVTKKGGLVVIIEGNRFNPLFYPHMVLMRGHNHFRQKYFVDLVCSVFPHAKFKFFEAHLYPEKLVPFFKIYEFIMEKFMPRKFLAYNAAICEV